MDVTWHGLGQDVDQGFPRRFLPVVFLVVLETNLLSLLNITDIMLRASGKRNLAPNLAAGAKKKSNQGKFNIWSNKSMLKKGLETLQEGHHILLKAE